MRILFLNQYFPPDPAPTGVLFREVADEFLRLGHEVDFVDAGQDYRGAQGGGGRMKRELGALWRMLREGRARQRPDVVVSGSSPPCLGVVADRVARKHGAAHIHWAMDMYPELAVELGEIRRGSLVAKITGWAMRSVYRRAKAVVALDEDMAQRFRALGVEPVCIRPWVTQQGVAVAAREPEAPWTWIYSGNLGRAHEWETLLAAQALLEQRGVDARLLFQGGGPSWKGAQAKAAALGLRHCEWQGYAATEELPGSLLRCEVLVATQLPAVRGLLWPSKLALMLTLPRPILFVGPTDGASPRNSGALRAPVCSRRGTRMAWHAGSPAGAHGGLKFRRMHSPIRSGCGMTHSQHGLLCLSEWRKGVVDAKFEKRVFCNLCPFAIAA